MKPREFAALLFLAAIWGASFLFMRIAAAPFGPVPLILVRVSAAAVCLLPLALVTGGWQDLRTCPRELLVTGLLNSAVPFCLLAFASLNLTAGFTALLNALTPLMTALIGLVWYGQRFQRAQWCGLAVGISGTVLLCRGQPSFKEGGSGWAVGAALLAACSYGLAAHDCKRHLAGAAPLITSAGSMAGATLILLPAGIWRWPVASPKRDGLAVGAGSGDRLHRGGISHLLSPHPPAGPIQASWVTFLVPIFEMPWSRVFLHEPVTARMLMEHCTHRAKSKLLERLGSDDAFGVPLPSDANANGRRRLPSRRNFWAKEPRGWDRQALGSTSSLAAQLPTWVELTDEPQVARQWQRLGGWKRPARASQPGPI